MAWWAAKFPVETIVYGLEVLSNKRDQLAKRGIDTAAELADTYVDTSLTGGLGMENVARAAWVRRGDLSGLPPGQ